jgi:hypothetical protein
MEAKGDRRYSSYSSTSAVDGGKWPASRPGCALLPCTHWTGAGWAPEPVWTQRLEKKSFGLCRGLNLDRLVVQSVARHYTDLATPVPTRWTRGRKISEDSHAQDTFSFSSRKPICLMIWKSNNCIVQNGRGSTLTKVWKTRHMYKIQILA